MPTCSPTARRARPRGAHRPPAARSSRSKTATRRRCAPRLYRSRRGLRPTRRGQAQAIADWRRGPSPRARIRPSATSAAARRGSPVQDIDGAIADLDPGDPLQRPVSPAFRRARLRPARQGRQRRGHRRLHGRHARSTPRMPPPSTTAGSPTARTAISTTRSPTTPPPSRSIPIYALAYNNRGYVYEAQGDKPAAAADFRRALALDPSLAGAKNGLKRLGEPADVRGGERQAHRAGQVARREELRLVPCHRAARATAPTRARRAGATSPSGTPSWRCASRLSRGIARPHDEMPKFELSDDGDRHHHRLHQQPCAP